MVGGGTEPHSLRIAMAQINCIVGDLEGNTAKILDYIAKAKTLGVDLIAFPEMAVTGYPAEDLLLNPRFIRDNQAKLAQIANQCQGITAVVGFVDANDDIYNAAAIIHDGKLVGVCHKIYLPNYGVFDECRYFQTGTENTIYIINGIAIGINICEDIWYPAGPTTWQAYADAVVIVNINASPYHKGKRALKEKMLATRATDNAIIVAYVNMVGGQDELVFDGQSLILDPKGEMVTQGKQFEEEMVVADLDLHAVFRQRLHDPRRRQEKLPFQPDSGGVTVVNVSEKLSPKAKTPLPTRESSPLQGTEEVYAALVLGTRDYVRKNGFQKVVIGLSGGVDSSLTAAIAMDALGPENVIGVAMPSRYSSPDSMEDAKAVAKNLSIKLEVIPIEEPFRAFLDTLSQPFAGREPDIAEENLQARVRGNIIMALSNKFNWMVLTTGNKSEMATGYSTLYGDMAGGFAVIKDVPKSLVYDLARYRNAREKKALIPQSVLDKEPSAELKPDQKDTDTLPPYPILDPILQAYVEEDMSYEEIVAMGFKEEVVKKVIKLVDSSEYKRRQSPPGIKITPRAFGKDRRLPIVNKYRSF